MITAQLVLNDLILVPVFAIFDH